MASGGNFTGLGPHQKAFIKLLDANAYRHRRHEVFRDFCELSALAVSNRMDKLHFDVREARYMELIKRYSPEEVRRFPHMLQELTEAIGGDDFGDHFGELFMALELGDSFKGQFYTPYSVCSLMASLTLGNVDKRIEEDGFITVHEPAVGAGAMVIAVADALAAKRHYWPHRMHAICYDIDATAVHMCYLQLSLLGIPAIVVHGNSLTLKEWDHWATPMHIMGRWDARLAKQRAGRPATQAGHGVPTPVMDTPMPTMAPDLRDEPIDLCEVGAVVVLARVEKAEQLGLF